MGARRDRLPQLVCGLDPGRRLLFALLVVPDGRIRRKYLDRNKDGRHL